jgi:protein TonB
MFDVVVNGHRNIAGRPAMPLAISCAAHMLGVAAVAVPLLLASDVVPSLPDAITAFVITAPAPPPPPAATPAPKASTPRPVRLTRADIRPPQVLQSRETAAPVQPVPEDIVAVDGEESSPIDGLPGGIEGGVPGGVLGGVVGSLPVQIPPPPPMPEAPIRTGGEIQAPALVKQVAPVYPPLAVSAGVEGIVILEATVGRDGRVEGLSVLRSVKLLENAALDAVRQWRYAPLLLNGKPERFILTVTVNFSLT